MIYNAGVDPYIDDSLGSQGREWDDVILSVVNIRHGYGTF